MPRWDEGEGDGNLRQPPMASTMKYHTRRRNIMTMCQIVAIAKRTKNTIAAAGLGE